MDYVRGQGFPAPAVDEISPDGLDMVIERIEGPDMVAMMEKRPWTFRQLGRSLADLHRHLHDLSAPDWLSEAPVGHGDSLLHLDLHPLNVMIGPRGPVVIDWARACRGDAAVDEAIAWVLMAAGEVPGSRFMAMIVTRARSVLMKSFLTSVEIDAIRPVLRDVVAWKASDPHMSAAEQDRMWEVCKQAGGVTPAWICRGPGHISLRAGVAARLRSGIPVRRTGGRPMRS